MQNMQSIHINCPDTVLISLKDTPESFARELCINAAMMFYETGRLSSGRAAELAGISRVSFLNRLAEFKISIIDESFDELQEDLKNA